MNDYIPYALIGAVCLLGLGQLCRKLNSANGKLRSNLERQRRALAASMYGTDYVVPALRFLRGDGGIVRSQHGTLLTVKDATNALSRTWAACYCKALSGLAFNCGVYFEMDNVDVDRGKFLLEIEDRALRLKNAADEYLLAMVTNGSKEAESEAAWLVFAQAAAELEKENAGFQDRYCLQRC